MQQTIIGLVLNSLGILLLMYSFYQYVTSAEIMLNAHEVYILSVNSRSNPVTQVTGADYHLNRGKKFLSIGLPISAILILAGTALQILQLAK